MNAILNLVEDEAPAAPLTEDAYELPHPSSRFRYLF